MIFNIRKLLLLLFFILISSFLISETEITFCSKKYKILNLYYGVEIENCYSKILTNEITSLDFKKTNIDSLLKKNRYSLIVFSTAYGIG
jgi:hypothetical protein